MFDLALLNGSVYYEGRWQKKNIYISGKHIAMISDTKEAASELLDVSNRLVMPSLIDPHVHFNLDLGQIRSRDDFLAGSIQAAYGGITHIIDFLDPVDHVDDLEAAYKRRLQEAKDACVDYSFHATIKDPKGDLEAFVIKMKSLGLRSLKLFTTYSESGRRTDDEHIIELLKLSEKYQFLLLAHVENDDLIDLDKNFSYRDLSRSRPSLAETKEALKLASYVRQYGGYLYMVHTSSGYTLRRLKEAYSDILNRRFFIESCPQYFVLNETLLNREDGYLYTLAPPLRSIEESSLLKTLIDDVYSIGTDHCAFFKDDKSQYYLKDIPLGIGGIEFSFDLMYHMFGDKIIDKMSKNIARLFGFDDLGEIKEGKRANLFVYELMINDIDEFHGFTDYSPYWKMPRKGRVIHTLKNGQFLVKNLQFNYQKADYI